MPHPSRIVPAPPVWDALKGPTMKAAYIAGIGILARFLSACVTGDQVTSYVIGPDGAIAFPITRINLTSDQTGEDAKKDFVKYLQELDEMRGAFFTKLVKANAKEVNVTIFIA